MEEQCSPLSWGFHYDQEEGIEGLKQYSLFYSTLELEAAILSAHEELSRKDDEIFNLKGLLSNIIKERDEYQEKCHTLVLEKQHLIFQQILQMQALPSSGNTTSNEEDDNIALSPSNHDENNVIASSPCKENSLPPPLSPPLPPSLPPRLLDFVDCKKPLPEKGKFLKAVMEAGPLLQTLLLAGPLPQWQHPPPKLNSIDIPPVTISSPQTRISPQDSCLISPINGGFCNKRAMVNSEGSNFSPNSKYQKVVPQLSSLTQHLVSP